MVLLSKQSLRSESDELSGRTRLTIPHFMQAMLISSRFHLPSLPISIMYGRDLREGDLFNSS